MKTLIIDDDPLSLLEHEDEVESFGFECTCCSDAATALEAYRQTFYPLILHDLELPDMDGLELCRRIRSLPHGKKSIILVISGRDTPEDIQAAMEAGADEYLLKPVRPKLLHECLAVLTQRIVQNTP